MIASWLDAMSATIAGMLSGPLSALDPAGPASESIARVWWAMLAASVVILLITVALALYAACRNPQRRARASPQALILGGGLIVPIAVLLALLIYGIGSGHALLVLPGGRSAVRVDVIAHQWWWEVRYPDAEGGPVYSANEIHVPAATPIDISVQAEDVVHGFWIPRLGGKIDAIPGRVNRIRLEARAPGVYHGVCAEFCGAQHARMALRLQAHEPERWPQALARLIAVDRPLLPAPEFDRHCARCHSRDARVRGPGLGPNLAGVPRRATLGAGTLPNDAAALQRWLREHPRLKPGNRMALTQALDERMIAALIEEIGGEAH